MFARMAVPAFAVVAFAALGSDSPPSAVPKKVEYYAHVRPILERNCVSCHRAGGAGPFPLDSAERAKNWSSMIARVTESRRMPPWLASDENTFRHERRLETREIEILRRWNEQATPIGSPIAPTAAREAVSDGWTLGKPDAELRLTKPFIVPAEGSDLYRHFVIKNPFSETKWLRAVQVRPRVTGVVHHVTVFTDRSESAEKFDRSHRDGQAGYTSMGGPRFRPNAILGFWAPGLSTQPFPTDTAIALRTEETIVVSVHYTPSGKAEVDDWRVGLYFSEKPKSELRVGGVECKNIDIPAGAKDYHAHAQLPVPDDMHLHAVMPHQHGLGKTFRAFASLPDGTKRSLITIPAWDPSWQNLYWYRNPPAIPRGSKLEIDGGFDNTSGNPRNPTDPPRRVRLGEAATDEMCLFIFLFTVDADALAVKTDGIKTAATR